MDIRQNEKIVSIKDRQFKIHKFDPFTGNAIMRDLLTTALPINITDILPAAMGIVGSMGTSKTMSRQEFVEFQRELLSNTAEVLRGGDAPVIAANGDFGIIDADMTIVFELLKEVIVFNFGGFFVEGLSLLGITKAQQPSDGNPPDAKT